MTKRIGILTSGGDCAGLNAVIRAVAHRAIEGYGWEVLGIKYGTVGLTQNPKQYCNLTLDMIDGNMLRLGGTILGTTNKGTPQDFTKEILAAIQDLNIDAIIGVGGDGSLKILNDLMKKGNVNFIGIPKTIDNDLGSTEISIGFSTAVEVATEALDRLQPTAASHDRVMILEVMGRDAGHIALNAGIAGGADVVLIPEIPYSLDIVANKIKQINQRGRNFALVVVAESVKTENGQPSMITDMEGRKRYGGIGHYLSEKIAEKTKAETRCTVLGHVQRGGQPNASDRVLAAALGIHAVDLIAKNQYSRMVAWQNRQVVDVAIEHAIAQYEAVNVEGTLVRTARGLGICFGDQ